MAPGSKVRDSAIAFTAGKIDIEHMQLVVAGGDLPVRSDEIGSVGDLAGRELHAERADMQPDAELLGERLEPLERRRLVLDLELGEKPLGLELHDRGVLGRLHVDGAAFRGTADQRLGHLHVGSDGASGPELNQTRTEGSFRSQGHSPVALAASISASSGSSFAARSSSASSS